jgi:glycosyltransferase involved in cell wall biosynthesis
MSTPELNKNVESGPLVSVVTPFYNTREFLAECIESVLRQTYENWEYVLVDNQSTDGSSEIANWYAARWPEKIRVVRTERFLSQSQNYSFALTCISPNGKYCKMVQADDWVFPDCIRSMVEVAEEHPSVGLVSAYELEGDRVSLDGLKYPSPEVPGRDVGRLYFLSRIYLFGTPTSLLLRSDLVRARTPFFDERFAPFEDAHACFDLLKASNFGFVHQVLTFSRRDNESILSRIRPYKFLLFARLAAVVLHGRDYLSEGEYDRVLRDAEREYFAFLGESVCLRSGSDFWAFHRKSLASLHYSLGARLLFKWVARAILEYVRSPLRTWNILRAHHGANSLEASRYPRQQANRPKGSSPTDVETLSPDQVDRTIADN